jgi:hypothetical protein
MSLPKLLAGPIVRRVEREAVSFWVALSGNHLIDARIWSGLQKASVTEAALGESLNNKPKLLEADARGTLFVVNILAPYVLIHAPPKSTGSRYAASFQVFQMHIQGTGDI